MTRASYRRRTAVSSPKYSPWSSTWRPIASNQASARSDARLVAGEPLGQALEVADRLVALSRVEAGLGAADLAPGEEHRLVQRLGLGRHVLGGVPRRRLGGVLLALPAEAGSAGPRSGKPGSSGMAAAARSTTPPSAAPSWNTTNVPSDAAATAAPSATSARRSAGRRRRGVTVPSVVPRSISWF